MSRAKNPKYESMSLEELKANMEKSRQELEAAIHNRLLKQLKKQRREMTANGTVSFFSKTGIQRKRADGGRFRSLYFRAEDL